MDRVPLPSILIHAGSWISLPADARYHLNTTTGDQLEVEVVDGALVLRLAGTETKSEPAVQAVTPVKRGPGRPRKVVA
jgi:bifunctional DNA-binding transcriptional regulator/antitoxin component of YhaV-PrlF toxin-antitoxin module